MSNAPERITKLLAQSQVTGIDFIYVYPGQTMLDVYFLRSVTTLDAPLPDSLMADDIEIYNLELGLPNIAIDPVLKWTTIDGQDILRLTTLEPGDFSLYQFKINDLRIDAFYNDISFSFKANCPSDLDCKPVAADCPPDESVDFPIDYLARDFRSFRNALLDFAALRYPDWADRLEADAGVMMLEAMSALGDEMAYYQDRINREAYLETATQRRSVRRHARLIDYTMHDGLGATAWLDFTVNDNNSYDLHAGTVVFTQNDQNERVDFEVGHGLAEVVAGKTYKVSGACNAFLPHFWDENQTCLPVGTIEFYLEGDHEADLVFDDVVTDSNGIESLGKWVLLITNPTDPAQPIRTQMVRLTTVTKQTDEVFGTDITFIAWEANDALTREFDMTSLSVHSNMIPATAGTTYQAFFGINTLTNDLSSDQLQAFQPFSYDGTVERQGHDATLTHLFTLPGSQNLPLVQLGNLPENGQPEIVLQEMMFDGSNWITNGSWTYQSSFLGVNSSESTDNHFTLDDGTWQRIVGYQRIGPEFVHKDYAEGGGLTIRFGDGEFGRIPADGTIFRVTYRLGGGRRSNVAAGSINNQGNFLSFISAVTNPLPASFGRDAETAIELRLQAPDAFRAITYRAVRPEDYAEAAERLDWVQKAGAAFRWTGSWLTAFVTPDVKGSVVLEDDQREALTQQMDRFRQAGREVCVMDPRFANIDLDIDICVDDNSYRGEVKQRVFEALAGKKTNPIKPGFFSPDRFTFGTLLERPALEAAIQNVPGVKAVESIRYRRRGWFDWQDFSSFSYNPGLDVIIRIENDPLHPDRGIFKLYTHGGL